MKTLLDLTHDWAGTNKNISTEPQSLNQNTSITGGDLYASTKTKENLIGIISWTSMVRFTAKKMRLNLYNILRKMGKNKYLIPSLFSVHVLTECDITGFSK